MHGQTVHAVTETGPRSEIVAAAAGDTADEQRFVQVVVQVQFLVLAAHGGAGTGFGKDVVEGIYGLTMIPKMPSTFIKLKSMDELETRHIHEGVSFQGNKTTIGRIIFNNIFMIINNLSHCSGYTATNQR